MRVLKDLKKPKNPGELGPVNPIPPLVGPDKNDDRMGFSDYDNKPFQNYDDSSEKVGGGAPSINYYGSRRIQRLFSSGNCKGLRRKHSSWVIESTATKRARQQMEQMVTKVEGGREVVTWIADHLTGEMIQLWVLRSWLQDPPVLSPDNQHMLDHYDALMRQDKSSAYFKSLNLAKGISFADGIRQLQEAESKWQETITHEENEWTDSEGEKILDLGNGWAWWDLKTSVSKDEGNAMGHCGNEADQYWSDTILSLRQQRADGKLRPSLTFIYNNGWIGEMKGRNNTHPAPKYHGAIVELLKQPFIKGLASGMGYLPEADFRLSDLNEKSRTEVARANPNLRDLDSVSGLEKIGIMRNMPIKWKDQLPEEILNIKTDEDIRNLIKESPGFAARYFKDKFTDEDIQNFIKERPTYAIEHFKDKFTDKDIRNLIKERPGFAARHFKDKFTDKDIQNFIKEDPGYAIEHFKDKFTDEDIRNLIKEHPTYADEYFKDKFTDEDIRNLIKERPTYAIKYFKDKFTDEDIRNFIKEYPGLAIEHFKDKLTDEDIRNLIKERPTYAIEYFKDKLTDEDIRNLIKEDPGLARYFPNYVPPSDKAVVTTAQKLSFLRQKLGGRAPSINYYGSRRIHGKCAYCEGIVYEKDTTSPGGGMVQYCPSCRKQLYRSVDPSGRLDPRVDLDPNQTPSSAFNTPLPSELQYDQGNWAGSGQRDTFEYGGT